jgi:hypothetical protein
VLCLINLVCVLPHR